MDTSAMVKKIALVAIGIVAVLLIVAAWRITRRCDGKDRSDAETASAAETSVPPKKEPLTDDEVQACARAFEEIGEAYSNLQFEKMQEIFCGISNKVARLGKDWLDKPLATLQASFRERFWIHDVKSRRFSAVSEFERFIRANIAAANIIGCTLTAAGVCDSHLREYDMVVFNKIKVFLKKFEEENDDDLTAAAQALLDEWKGHLASGQSITRMQLRLDLKMCLRLPRWEAEDMGMKSERDWVAYWRDYALKVHKQWYGVEPTWLDEEFPLEQNPDQR